MEFSEQIVVVTGAGQGIGFAIARAFALAGSRVVINDINGDTCAAAASAITREGGTAVGIRADVSSPEEVAAMLTQVQQTWGYVTTLVNNAGVVTFKPLQETSMQTWQRTIDVDLTGVFVCTQACAAHMRAAGQGAIVNISSVHATATIPHTAAYAAAKTGVIGMTRTLALELGRDNIRINSVSPGAIETDALRTYFEQMPPDTREKERAHMLNFQALPFFGSGDDVADAVMFLCGPRARYITGTELVVDGGVLARLF